jgi:hypothetical protein
MNNNQFIKVSIEELEALQPARKTPLTPFEAYVDLKMLLFGCNRVETRKIQDEEKMAWELALRWFIYDDDSDIDVTKDILFFGDTGRSKTFLAKCLMELGKRIGERVKPSERWYYDWNYNDLVDLWEQCDEANTKSYCVPKTVGNWIFDELGNEPKELNLFGNRHRFFERILTVREKGSTPKRAIYISNLSKNEILKYYNSNRFRSRFLSSLGGAVLFGGVDKR